jgi:hypothetical protein
MFCWMKTYSIFRHIDDRLFLGLVLVTNAMPTLANQGESYKSRVPI